MNTTILVLGIGVFLAVGLWGLAHNIRCLVTWPVTTGVVVENVISPLGDGGTKAPIVEYRTPDGQPWLGTDRFSTAWSRYRPGRTVTIRYDVHRPQRLVIGYQLTVAWVILVVWMVAALVLVTKL